MSIIVAVSKGSQVVMAADTQENFGEHAVPAVLRRAEKFRPVGDALLGCAGWAVYGNLLDDYLPRQKKVNLGSSKAIFSFFLDFWQALREDYSLVNPQPGEEEDATAFGELDSDFLVAHKNGIYHVSSQMAVVRFDRFAAIGSGSDYAAGALYALYDGDLDASGLARRAVETAMAFRPDCGGEVHLTPLPGE
jgi:ATP-dependent protease HslVU (ClpYQ) peptidase subunit